MDGTVGSVVPCVSVFTFLNGFLAEIIAVLTAVSPGSMLLCQSSCTTFCCSLRRSRHVCLHIAAEFLGFYYFIYFISQCKFDHFHVSS